jgi:hypothetical protein
MVNAPPRPRARCHVTNGRRGSRFRAQSRVLGPDVPDPDDHRTPVLPIIRVVSRRRVDSRFFCGITNNLIAFIGKNSPCTETHPLFRSPPDGDLQHPAINCRLVAECMPSPLLRRATCLRRCFTPGRNAPPLPLRGDQLRWRRYRAAPTGSSGCTSLHRHSSPAPKPTSPITA